MQRIKTFLPYIQVKTSNKVFPLRKLDLGLSNDFKSAIIHMFKELKEIISKVFKKNMSIMPHQKNL